MNWYMAVYDDDSENEYEQYLTDEDAVAELLNWAAYDERVLLEIHRCNDDETLSPAELIYH